MKISLLTLFHNRREVSARFVAECRGLAARGHELEWLWGDAASTDGTRELLARADGPGRLVDLGGNPGFAAGNNLLARQASGEVLVFLNNDVVFCEGWLEALCDTLAAHPGAVAGNLQLHVGGRFVHHAGMFFGADGVPFHYQPPLHALDRLSWMPVPAVTGCCLALSAALFRRLGGFDVSYKNGYEDTDLCLRARALGAEILCATRSVLWHHVCASPGRHAADAANEALFLGRHGDAARRLAAWRPPVLPAPFRARPSPLLAAEATLQVFYPRGGTYSEAASLHLPCPAGRRLELPVALVAADLRTGLPLRLDPFASPGRFSLHALRLEAARSGALLSRVDGARLADLCRPGGDASAREGAACSWLSSGEDPQLYLSLPDPVDEADDSPLLLFLDLELEPSEAGAEARAVPAPRPAHAERRRILVDLHALRPGGENGGIRRWVLGLLTALHARRPDLELTLVVRPSCAGELGALFPGCGLLPLSDAAYAACPSVPWAGLWDLLYAPLHYSRLALPTVPCLPLVADLLHRDMPQALADEERFSREAWMVEALASASAVQCNSAFVKDTVLHHYGVAEGSCFVVHNVLDGTPRPPVAAARRHDAATPFFLYPANAWPHKNHGVLLRAYAAYRSRVDAPWALVLTGHGLEALGPASAAPGVRVEGWLSRPAFESLLLGAGALVFPSLYEGFGMPVLEAMAAGVPVACSRAASLPEVAGGACLLFDPSEPGALAELLVRLHQDPQCRAELIRLGRERAAVFSLDREVTVLSARLDACLA